VLQVVLTKGGELSYANPLYSPKLTIEPGFQLAAASDEMAGALCGSKILAFNFGESRMRGLGVGIAEGTPVNLKFVAGNDGKNHYFAIDADNYKNIYVMSISSGGVAVTPIPKGR